MNFFINIDNKEPFSLFKAFYTKAVTNQKNIQQSKRTSFGLLLLDLWIIWKGVILMLKVEGR